MPVPSQTIERLAQIPNISLQRDVLLSRYTRFGIGGPADLLIESGEEAGFIAALRVAQLSGSSYVVIGGGTNLIVSDRGFEGMVLKFTASNLASDGLCVRADAGAQLQSLVDYTIAQGQRGVETMTGIPGSVGAAVYGNAGAYGHSIMETVDSVRYFDGKGISTLNNERCEFHYRESVFKRRKDWIIFSVALRLHTGDAADLSRTAAGILKIRNEKYPPTMKCAGSIFKNLILSELPAGARAQVPAHVVREGKVPSAWFLEAVDAKGMRLGDIQVADYHANLIYNDGQGTAHDLVKVIRELKARVRQRFGFDLEEEVQYVGFDMML